MLSTDQWTTIQGLVAWLEVPAPPATVVPVTRLLPTPKASDGPNGGPNQRDGQVEVVLPAVTVRLTDDWRVPETGQDFGPAIRRWESILGRPAPTPATSSMTARPRDALRANPAFYEWVMGLNEGLITSHTDMPRPEQIKRAGNSVVTLQAVAAYRTLRSAAPLLLSEAA